MSRRDKKLYEEYEKKAKKRKVKRWQKVLIGILLVLVAIFAGGYAFLNHTLNQISRDNDLDTTKLSAGNVEGYTNILLLGVDSRDMQSTEGARTDAIMIASINDSTGEISLTSIYRDTFLRLGDTGTYDKITHAHAYGGPALTIQTINEALDLDITEYVLVNFKGVADAVDEMGGITMNIEDYEIDALNTYTAETAANIGRTDYNLVTSPGEQTLDGCQAVSYGRIRKGVGDDFKRTERMRDVMVEVLRKARSMGTSQVYSFAKTMFPEMKTNMSNNTLISLLLDARKYTMDDSQGFPFENHTGMYNGVSYVFPDDLQADVEKLHQETFTEEGYTAPQVVVEISDGIKSVTGYY